MAVVKLSESLVDDAKMRALATHRSAPKQIEHWARLGKIAQEKEQLDQAVKTLIESPQRGKL